MDIRLISSNWRDSTSINTADENESDINYFQPSFQKNKTHDLTILLPFFEEFNNETNDESTFNYIDKILNSTSISSNQSPVIKPISLNNQADKIYAHKMKITEKSDYFRLLLTNGMKESSQHEVSIPNIPSDIFFEILKFLYSSELSISPENLVQIYLVCDRFLLEDGKQLCKQYISKVDNELLSRFLFEEEFNISPELSNLYIEQAISNSTYFLNVERVTKLSKEVLLRILNHNEISLKEIEIFKSTYEWVKANNISSHIEKDSILNEIFQNIRFPLMDYEEISGIVEPASLVPNHLLLEAYRHLSKPKYLPLKEIEIKYNFRLNQRKKPDPISLPGSEVYSIQCVDHKRCNSVSWPIDHFSSIKSQKHVSSTFEVFGLTWRMWAYPAGEAKHSDSFSVYLEAVRVKEKESYDFLRNTTFFFALVNHKNKTLSRHFPSSPNVLFNYDKSVWGNGLIELKTLYDKTLGYLENDTVTVQLHILECIALEG